VTDVLEGFHNRCEFVFFCTTRGRGAGRGRGRGRGAATKNGHISPGKKRPWSKILAALAGSALVEGYNHQMGEKPKRSKKHVSFKSHFS
jgi:hypothetical protein